MITERQVNHEERLKSLFLNSSFEMSPKLSLLERIESFDESTKFSIVSSHKKGVDATLDFTKYLVDKKRSVIPHLAARSVRDKKHVSEIIGTINDLNIKEVFILGGDNKIPVGIYDSAADFMCDFLKVNKSVEKIRITGYPEGHPAIPLVALNFHLKRKLDIARSYGIETSISTQICYDPEVTSSWMEIVMDNLKSRLKFNIGTPIPTTYPNLIKYSLYSGVGPSISFIQKLGIENAINLANFDTTGFMDSVSRIKFFSEVNSFHFFTFDDLDNAQTLKKTFEEG